MIDVIECPNRTEWPTLLQRPQINYEDISSAVQQLMLRVQKDGDRALLDFAAKYDGAALCSIGVAEDEWNAASGIETALKAAIDCAAANIQRFHAVKPDTTEVIETMPGIRCWRKAVAIEKVGLYIPGGTAPLFSTLLMLGIPSTLAGCREIVVCTPPRPDGSLPPAILYVAKLLGISRVYKAGGAGAIAAMAYGTETIPQVNKIFGPGNRYVTCAKLLLSASGFAIDMPAGPSELAILADDTCIPAFVAADLLSQAEHGEDSQVLLVSNTGKVIDSVLAELANQLEGLPRKAIALKALANSRSILVKDIPEGMAMINDYAPEHLIIACGDAESIAADVVNAGSVFIGHYAPESAGDYASGTNHALPTSAAAKAFSGVSVESFQKKITFQHLSPEGLNNISSTVVTMAEAEGLAAHAAAVSIRLTQFK